MIFRVLAYWVAFCVLVFVPLAACLSLGMMAADLFTDGTGQDAAQLGLLIAIGAPLLWLGAFTYWRRSGADED